MRIQLKHISKLIGTSLLCIAGICQANAQTEASGHSPSAANLLLFEQIPVSPYTGVPDVSVPLAQLPTRSKDVAFNFVLKYHPGSVSTYIGEGDLGKGWSLETGGLISRVINPFSPPDEDTFLKYPNEPRTGLPLQIRTRASNLYQYSILGNTGRFIAELNLDNTMSIEIIESSAPVNITMVYDPSTYKISSFTVYDAKGYGYIFDTYDQISRNFTDRGIISYRSAYYMSKIIDNNSQVLATADFITHTYQHLYFSPFPIPDDVLKKITAIHSPGYGSANFNFSIHNVLPGMNKRYLLHSLTLKDYKGTSLKKFDFSLYQKNLAKVEESNFIDTKKIVHKFDYQNSPTRDESMLEADDFGFYRLKTNCERDLNHRSDPDYCTVGVLNKINLPTGGSIAFDYESHNYFSDGMVEWSEEDYIYNDQNYTNLAFANHEFVPNGGSIWEFSVTGGPKELYFNVTTPGRYIDGIGNQNGDNAVYAKLFLYGPNGATELSPHKNYKNNCHGEKILLQPGQYSILRSMVGFDNANESVTIMERTKKTGSNISRWHYGGGIRIKRIGFFDTETLPNYYRDYDGMLVPQKEISYSYNFFDNPNSSSGSIAFSGFNLPAAKASILQELVGYKNVTVKETGGNGKTEYTYVSPFDFPVNNLGNNPIIQHYYDYKRGNLLKTSVYNGQNELLSEAVNTYEYHEVDNASSPIYVPEPYKKFERNGWIKSISSAIKDYRQNSQVPVERTEIKKFSGDNRMLLSSESTNLTLGESLKTTYAYFPIVLNPHNRIVDISDIETYKNSELLSKQHNDYSKNFAGNLSYLPASISASKASQGLSVKTRFNSYDAFSNILETEKENDIKVSYVWGYKSTQIVAKIENASYASIPANLIAAIQNATDSATATEASVLTALNALRSSSVLTDAMITTYTYKPLLGLSTVTDPKGDRVTYEYDSFGRLKGVRDRENNLLSENEYHYKQ